MESCQAPLMRDKVTVRRNQHRRREGEYDPHESVNICHDRSGRTLLAWQGLMVIPCFMPGDLMQLKVTIRQLCMAEWRKDDQRRTQGKEISETKKTAG